MQEFITSTCGSIPKASSDRAVTTPTHRFDPRDNGPVVGFRVILSVEIQAMIERALWVLVGLSLVWVPGCSEPASAPTPTTSSIPDMPPGPAQPKGTIAERLVNAKQLAEARNLPKAIETLEDGLRIDHKDRESLRLLALYLKDRAREVSDAATTEYYRSLVSAAEYYRRLRDSYPDLTEEEKKLGLDVFYEEATAHARSLRVEETTGSLRDLVGAGFKDFDRIRNDPRWKPIRELSRFSKEFDEIAGTGKKP